MAKIVAIGNALVDSEFVVTDAQLHATGLTKGNMTLASHSEQADLIASLTTQNITATKQAGGGSAANSIYAAASLGSDTFYACRVGEDEAGRFYLADLNAAGIKTSTKSFADGTTGSCMVMVTPDGERTMQTHLGTSAEISETDIEFDALNDADWLYLEGYLAMSPSVQQAIAQLKQQAKDKGAKIAVSFADPAVVKFGREGLDAMLEGGVDAVFCNCDEAQLFTNQSSHSQAAAALLSVADMAVVTNGAAGSIIALRDDVSRETKLIDVASLPVDQVLDTNGAGDNFAGSFLYALSHGHALADCGKLASSVASQIIQQFGPRLKPAQYQAILQSTLT